MYQSSNERLAGKRDWKPPSSSWQCPTSLDTGRLGLQYYVMSVLPVADAKITHPVLDVVLI